MIWLMRGYHTTLTTLDCVTSTGTNKYRNLVVVWAKAMGAKVVGMSHNDKKKDVAFELGADEYVVISDSEALAKYKHKFFALVLAKTFNNGRPNASLFRPNGIFINVGLPEWNFSEIRPMLLAMSQVTICGSAIGSPAEIEDMLELAAKSGVSDPGFCNVRST